MMILAVYTKNRSKDTFQLYALAESMEAAKKQSRLAIKKAKKMGFENPAAVIQGFDSIDNIPKLLEVSKIHSEKLLYN